MYEWSISSRLIFQKYIFTITVELHKEHMFLKYIYSATQQSLKYSNFIFGILFRLEKYLLILLWVVKRFFKGLAPKAYALYLIAS